MNRWSRRWVALTLALVTTTATGAGWPTAPDQNVEAAPASPAASSNPAGGAAAMVPAEVRAGEILVKVRPRRARGMGRALGRVDGATLRSLGRGVSLVRVPPGTEHSAAQRLAADPAVRGATPNYVRTAAAHSAAELGWGVRRVRAPSLWHGPTPVQGAGVRVAVIDSGVDNTHDQLAHRVERGFDLYGGRGRDDCGHGTAVAGVIAAALDGRETAGVAPSAQIVPVKVLRFDEFHGCAGDDAEIIEGLTWAADPERGNADIINMSLSGPHRSSLLRDAIDYATQQGVLVVAAAGNTGDREVQYPAAYPNVLSVGGLERAARSVRWWPHSSFAGVDVAAAAKAVPVITARGVDPSMVARHCADRAGWCADGTSFAAPHVAGVAALLFERHALGSVAAGARLRRLNPWILGRAPRVPGRHRGMDLKTGHGEADALAARNASFDADRRLLTWHTGPRIIGPTPRMHAVAPSVKATFMATTGTGEVLANRRVRFRPESGGSVTTTRTATSAGGRVATTFRSTAAGTTTQLEAIFEGQSLPFDVYVLQRDDNVPGVRLPPSPLHGALSIAHDIDDVYRVYLRAHETLRARLTGIGRSEYAELFLHRAGTRDVTNPFLAPLQEPAPYNRYPRVMRRTVGTDGVRFLDAYGYGSYGLRWSIYSPNKVRALTADPKTFSPNGDGAKDRVRLSWRLARRGRVVVRIRNAEERLVREVDLGREAQGRRVWRWAGRNDNGSVVRSGDYRVTVRWENHTGRVSKASRRVTVRR